jgi:hypothetical protein
MGMKKMAKRYAGLKEDCSKTIQGIIAEVVAGEATAEVVAALENLRTVKADNDYEPTVAGFAAVKVAEKNLTSVYYK